MEKVTAGREALGAFAPKFAQLNDDVLFGEVWAREKELPLRDRSLITIPAGVKHWHGAKADSWFSHIAVEIPGDDTRNEWCEPVSDEEYRKLG
ncbi:hypothetical protein M2454_002490 [Aequitasia blattaphilus]|uniref:Uncharacterized protein n=1 Tax=Aequitasia blattaphilus TaxID=2949332 RepID=A0ABT1EB43_9FIRM|nr:hypothetical protein [Aequitasia blattaphilus]MCP1103032.1 hypothetical protein [Aequitasia blattaphilus]MCR8615672.1 hypothetical protein [Aequitasia blattaphilus]